MKDYERNSYDLTNHSSYLTVLEHKTLIVAGCVIGNEKCLKVFLRRRNF